MTPRSVRQVKKAHSSRRKQAQRRSSNDNGVEDGTASERSENRSGGVGGDEKGEVTSEVVSAQQQAPVVFHGYVNFPLPPELFQNGNVAEEEPVGGGGDGGRRSTDDSMFRTVRPAAELSEEGRRRRMTHNFDGLAQCRGEASAANSVPPPPPSNRCQSPGRRSLQRLGFMRDLSDSTQPQPSSISSERQRQLLGGGGDGANSRTTSLAWDPYEIRQPPRDADEEADL